MSTDPTELTADLGPVPPPPTPTRRPAWLAPAALGTVAGIVIGAGGLALVQAVTTGGGDGRLTAALEECTDSGTGSGLELGDDGRTLRIDTAGDGDASDTGIEYGLCVLWALDIPDSVMGRIQQTTSLDGQQEGTWDGITATWTYHPDRGLDAVLTLD